MVVPLTLFEYLKRRCPHISDLNSQDDQTTEAIEPVEHRSVGTSGERIYWTKYWSGLVPTYMAMKLNTGKRVISPKVIANSPVNK